MEIQPTIEIHITSPYWPILLPRKPCMYTLWQGQSWYNQSKELAAGLYIIHIISYIYTLIILYIYIYVLYIFALCLSWISLISVHLSTVDHNMKPPADSHLRASLPGSSKTDLLGSENEAHWTKDLTGENGTFTDLQLTSDQQTRQSFRKSWPKTKCNKI